MEYIEITAKTVSEAITKACMQLGIPSDRLDIQVISEGSKGFLGIGNKPAVIKVAEKSEAEEAAAEKEEVQEEIFEEKVVVSENVSEEIPKEDHTEKEKHRNPRNRRRDNRRKNNRKAEGFAEANEIPAEKPVVVEEKREPLIKTEEEIAAMKESAGSFLKDVFAAMEMSRTDILLWRRAEEKNRIDIFLCALQMTKVVCSVF